MTNHRSNETGDFQRARITHLVDQHGWAHIFTAHEQLAPEGYSYTIGLQRTYGLPDLVTFALPPEVAGGLLRDIVEAATGTHAVLASGHEGGGTAPNFVLAADADFPEGIRAHALAFRAVHPSWTRAGCDLLAQALNFYRRPVPFLQVLWPDPNGRLPADPRCAPEYVRAQPDLSRRHRS
ncbi:DUF4262 domain-containing protein [Actinomadura viridis]|uniref:DUF4262 domain-containing protein n=1 Tax=Actinomadura viridis TaxID=58110 RepID=UPI0036B96B2D